MRIQFELMEVATLFLLQPGNEANEQPIAKNQRNTMLIVLNYSLFLPLHSAVDSACDVLRLQWR